MLSQAEVTEIKDALSTARADIDGWTHSALLEMADRGSHTVYSLAGQVLSIRGLSVEGSLQDVTNHFSSGWQEKASLLKKGGTMVFSVHFPQGESGPGAVNNLLGAAFDQTLEYFRLRLPDGSYLQFTAFAGITFSASTHGRLTGEVTLECSGAVIAGI